MCNENYKKEHESKLEIAVLNNSGSSMQFLKNQQWKLCYYTLLLYGTIIAAQNLLKWEILGIKVSLLILTGIVAVVSVMLNYKLRDSTMEHRKYVNNIYKNNEEQMKFYGIPIEQETKDDLLNFIFVGSAIIGGCLTMLIIAFYKK